MHSAKHLVIIFRHPALLSRNSFYISLLLKCWGEMPSFWMQVERNLKTDTISSSTTYVKGVQIDLLIISLAIDVHNLQRMYVRPCLILFCQEQKVALYVTVTNRKKIISHSLTHKIKVLFMQQSAKETNKAKYSGKLNILSYGTTGTSYHH